MHQTVVKRIKAGENPYRVLDSMSNADLGKLITFQNLFPCKRKQERITQLLKSYGTKKAMESRGICRVPPEAFEALWHFVKTNYTRSEKWTEKPDGDTHHYIHCSIKLLPVLHEFLRGWHARGETATAFAAGHNAREIHDKRR